MNVIESIAASLAKQLIDRIDRSGCTSAQLNFPRRKGNTMNNVDSNKINFRCKVNETTDGAQSAIPTLLATQEAALDKLNVLRETIDVLEKRLVDLLDFSTEDALTGSSPTQALPEAISMQVEIGKGLAYQTGRIQSILRRLAV